MSQKSDLPPKNDTKFVQVTVVVVLNGNRTYLRNQKDDPVLQVLEPVLLAILFLIAFTVNMFLLMTIISSFTLRKVPFNSLLANISFVCLPECLFNMLIAVYYTTTDAWKLGPTMCSLSAFVVQIVTLEITFGLCIMCVEGSISLWRPLTYQNYLTVKKQVVAIVTLWVAGILLCLPLLVGSISARAFPLRYGCASIGNDVGYAYSLFVTVWCYIIPMVLGFCSFIYLAFRKYRDYKARKSKKQDINYSDILFQGDLWTEWVNIKLVSFIVLLYIIFEIPFIVVHQMSSLKTFKSEISENVTLPLVEYTPKYETTFTWFRYVFVCLYPILTLWMRKDIRRKLQSLLNCCQRNAVGDHSARPVIRKENRKKKREEKKEDITPLSLTTPVLYISPDGLCLRQLDSSAKLNDKANNYLSPLQQNSLNWTVEPSFVSYLCDVTNYTYKDETTENTKLKSSCDETFNRRNSNESEISVTTLESELETLQSLSSSENLPEQSKLPQATEIIKPESPKVKNETKPEGRKVKKVRFAETLTIYKSITPVLYSPPPENIERTIPKPLVAVSGSKIPTRRQSVNDAPPWKVEMSKTYRVSAPVVEHKTVKAVVISNNNNDDNNNNNKISSNIGITTSKSVKKGNHTNPSKMPFRIGSIR